MQETSLDRTQPARRRNRSLPSRPTAVPPTGCFLLSPGPHRSGSRSSRPSPEQRNAAAPRGVWGGGGPRGAPALVGRARLSVAPAMGTPLSKSSITPRAILKKVLVEPPDCWSCVADSPTSSVASRLLPPTDVMSWAGPPAIVDVACVVSCEAPLTLSAACVVACEAPLTLSAACVVACAAPLTLSAACVVSCAAPLTVSAACVVACAA